MTTHTLPLLTARQLTLKAGQRVLLAGLDWQVHGGEFWCVLGRNGIGKSTLLHAAAGLQPPAAGQLQLLGQPLQALSAQQMALQRGLLLQQQQDAFSLPVIQAVEAGGFARAGSNGWHPQDDQRARALAALQRVGLAHLAAHDLLQLSGGERQRIGLATLLVQDPALYLLDEPTSHQDIAAQLHIMQLLRSLAAEGRGVVASCHDINLASRFATHVLLLGEDRRWAGPVAQVLVPSFLQAAFGCHFTQMSAGGSPVFIAHGADDALHS